jgi:NAD(P)-dependent dehydrogenase (short-subunit alcohol dehydrogenase family)
MPGSGHALVVGNTDGIGLALTKRLLEKGWNVTGVSRRASPLEAASYTHLVADVGAADYGSSVHELVATAPAIDVCVYCAGIGQLLSTDDLAGEPRVFRVNLLGAVETATAVLPQMLAARRGHFIGVSSIGDGVSAEAPSYAASKAGLSSYLEGLALALRPRGVRVTNVRFGFVDTKMAKSATRPFMITVERAVDVLMSCLQGQPARLTYPRRMAALMTVVRLLTAVRLWRS